MAAKKLTPEQLAARKQEVIEVLKRSPDLTIRHFKSHHGCSYEFLRGMEAEGVKFGKSARVNLRYGK